MYTGLNDICNGKPDKAGGGAVYPNVVLSGTTTAITLLQDLELL